MPQYHHNAAPQPEEEAVITKALGRMSHFWELSHKQLGEYLGLSEASISRLFRQQYTLKPHKKEWELALLLLRIFRGLDAFTGGHIENQKRWLLAHNTALGGPPITLMKNIEGLSNVLQYIDHMRGQ